MTKKQMIAKLEEFIEEGKKDLREGCGYWPATCCEGAELSGRDAGKESMLEDLSYLVDDLKKLIQPKKT